MNTRIGPNYQTPNYPTTDPQPHRETWPGSPSGGLPSPANSLSDAESAWKTRLAKAEALVSSHPGIALAVAAGVGLMLGWWMKRK